jgi:peroxiredoxin
MQSNDVIEVVTPLGGGISEVILFPDATAVLAGTAGRNAQLAAFARAADKFGGEDIKVVSVSVDDREKSEALVEKHKLGFPVAYGADARASG